MPNFSTLLKTGAAGVAAMTVGSVAAANVQNLTPAIEKCSVFGSRLLEAVSALPRFVSPHIRSAASTALEFCSNLNSRVTNKVIYMPAYVSEKGLTVYQGAVVPFTNSCARFLPALPIVIPALCAITNSMVRGYKARTLLAENRAIQDRLIRDQDYEARAETASARQTELLERAQYYKELADRKVCTVWNITKFVVTTVPIIFTPYITLPAAAAVTAGSLGLWVAGHYWEKSGNRSMEQTLQQEAETFGAFAEDAQKQKKREEQNRQLVSAKKNLEDRNQKTLLTLAKLAEEKHEVEVENERLKTEKEHLDLCVQNEKKAKEELNQNCEKLQKQVNGLKEDIEEHSKKQQEMEEKLSDLQKDHYQL